MSGTLQEQVLEPVLERLLDAAPGGRSADVADRGPLADLRAEGKRAIAATGLPTQKSEPWKYTSLNALRKVEWSGPVGDGADFEKVKSVLPALDAYTVVLLNGRFDSVLSDLAGLPKGVRVLPLPEAMSDTAVTDTLASLIPLDKAPMAALNTAHLDDGVLVRVDAGKALDKPLHIVSVGYAGGAPVAFHPRFLIQMDENAEATIIESHIGLKGAPTFSNTVSEVVLAPSARLGHYKLQDQAMDGFDLSTTAIRCADKSVYDGFTLSLGLGTVRNDVRMTLDGEHVEGRLNGAYIGHGGSHVDNTTFIDHAKPNSTSREVFKGVLADESRGVFQGKILVRPDAQNTDGHQLNKSLLISDKAEADSKPELEIYADDVRCSHGATIGDLDDDQLFYLRARGIDAVTARAMLVQAFLMEAIDEIQKVSVRDAFHEHLAARLQPLFKGGSV